MAPPPKIKSDTTPTFDEALVRSHIEMLHHLAAGFDGLLVVSTYYANPTGDRDAPGVVSHHVVGDVDGMVESVMAHASTPNANVFTGLQVMRKGLKRGTRGGEADIVTVLGLVVDLDADTGRTGEMPVGENLRLETSSGNFQPFVLFDEPLPAADAKQLAGALKRATGSDHGTADVAHVWRIPGTMNWPNKSKLDRGRSATPEPVVVAEPWDGSLTSVEQLRAALAPWASSAPDHRSVTVGELPSLEGITLSATATELLAANDVGDRSAWASKIVEQLAFDGLTAEQACAAFLAATGDWFRRYDGKDPVADFTRMWGKFGVPHEEERTAGAAAAAGIVAKLTAKAAPVAANDNKPAELSIRDWTVDRYVGEAPPVKWLVDGVIPLGVPGMVSAAGDTGKSFALLELHRRIAFGESLYASPIFGGKVAVDGTSVMITSEDDANEVHGRVSALDIKGERFSGLGKRMIVVPLPSAGGARAFWKEDRKLGLVETDDFKRICDQLADIDDLRLVTFDPLASFAHLPLNDDPTAGQFVCSSLARLAAETEATILTAHHMRKSQKPIENLSDAREAIRGSTALVDGLRVVYSMWPAEEGKARAACKQIGISWEPNRIVLGGIVKANGPARRILSTYARNEHGLLIDKTVGAGSSVYSSDDLRGALVAAVEAAAAAGSPFTKTGASGLYEMRERLPVDLQGLAKARLDALAAQALERGEIVRAAARGEKTAKWLDVPTGIFAIGLGNFSAGAPR